MSLGDEPDTTASGGYTGTRMRLPEGDPYAGGPGPRRRTSSPRSLVTVVAVVVLLVAAIAFANRGDDSSPEPTPANGPETNPTAPTGTRPVATGFAQNEQGAQSAASNYSVALGSTGMFDKDRRHTLVDRLYTSEAAARLKSPMDDAYSADFLSKLGLDADGNPPKGNTFVSRVVPVGATVQNFSGSSAKVAVWYLGLIGMSGERSTDPVTSTWKTWTFDLQWADGDWKIAADTQTDGPAPVPGDDRAATSDEISKAIEEYGGFTYAR
ncbi:hypothetical protein [Streptomyces sp. NPDC093094]|uniref:hypothetical protein n=1 Tax=Streptomyces sp. NPDC093094 TaxID=3366026 RepID=UPI003807C447